LTILPDEMLTIYVSGQTTLGAFYKFSSHKQDMGGAKLLSSSFLHFRSLRIQGGGGDFYRPL
jgi:hypothetical protein